MFKPLEIQSHKGIYSVTFYESLEIFFKSNKFELSGKHFLIDSRIRELYRPQLVHILNNPNVILIEAKEENKTLENIIPVLENLVKNKIRRDEELVAIGGGVIQDITCFIASILLRGISWSFFPTTLLAQADSCIGSKSSINIKSAKNILGTFYPPRAIFIISEFLNTLERRDLQSGIGEIIKVHAIESWEKFEELSRDFDQILENRNILLRYIDSALKIKKKYIEIDEFDRGIRNIFNYGHSFGHAIESATNFGIPHGIAVTIGMDMANFIASKREMISSVQYLRMHEVLEKNYRGFTNVEIPLDKLIDALGKDKKNTRTMLGLIFPVGENAKIEKLKIQNDSMFYEQCKLFLEKIKK
ncbi:MAG: iron-containing alcohol dehydrogenase [Leptospiraceae bacterium]|nr:iron-containing alcohol dehydrogenase [Leptospiraceae bacterium]